jgi:chaperonin GroEL
MPQKEILEDKASTESLIKGIDLASNIVKKTLGPKGGNVIYKDQWGIVRISNDGLSILRQMYADNDTEIMAIEALQQQAEKTNMLAGDASTTFVTLAQAILNEGLKSKKHPLEKRAEIAYQAEQVVEMLKQTSRPVETFEEIKQVATVSVEDEEIGHKIAEAYLKVGKEGQLIVQESDQKGVNIDYISGFELNSGFISEIMMNTQRGEAVINNPYILIADSRIATIKDIEPVLIHLANNGVTELLILCDGMESNILRTIASNKRAKYMEGKRVMEIFAVAVPEIKKSELLADIALVTEGTIAGAKAGLPFNEVGLNHLGRCEKAIITKDKTTLIGGKGNVEELIKAIKAQDEPDQDRISRLRGQVATLKVGASSGVDLGYLKDKIDDAIYATKGAMEEGAVRGGGIALKMIAQELPEGILKEALQAPYNQIQENAGGKFKIEDYVMDSVKSTRIVVENACSFAGSLLTTFASIATKHEKVK